MEIRIMMKIKKVLVGLTLGLGLGFSVTSNSTTGLPNDSCYCGARFNECFDFLYLGNYTLRKCIFDYEQCMRRCDNPYGY